MTPSVARKGEWLETCSGHHIDDVAGVRQHLAPELPENQVHQDESFARWLRILSRTQRQPTAARAHLRSV